MHNIRVRKQNFSSIFHSRDRLPVEIMKNRKFRQLYNWAGFQDVIVFEYAVNRKFSYNIFRQLKNAGISFWLN